MNVWRGGQGMEKILRGNSLLTLRRFLLQLNREDQKAETQLERRFRVVLLKFGEGETLY